MSQFKEILLVDDDASSNFLSELIIRDCGFSEKVYTCRNGREALNFLYENETANKQPELIFLDLNMPVMDGFEFLKVYNPGNIRIVVLTSSQNPADIERTKEFAVSGYLHKPITEEKLKTLL